MIRLSRCCMVLAASCLLIAGAGAQRSQAAPDALLLVQPQGRKAIVSVTFPGLEPHARVRDRIARLARAAGWTVASLEVKDEVVLTAPQFGPSRPMGKQTGALATLDRAVQVQQRAFRLQPYVEAFSDLQRVDLLFFMAPIPAFQGLRDYQSAGLSVKLVRDGGPYHYRIDIRDRSGALPTLPLTQPPAPTAPTEPMRASESPADDRPSFALVVAIAAASGLSVLLLWFLLTRARTWPSPRAHPRRASRL